MHQNNNKNTMNMKHLSYKRTALLFLVTVSLTYIPSFGGNKGNVKDICNYVYEQYNIAWTFPKDFDAKAHDALFMGINFDYEAKGTQKITHPAIYPYWIQCTSKDKNCILLFPMQKMINERVNSLIQKDSTTNVAMEDCKRELCTAVTKDERTKVSAAFMDSICQKHLIKYGGEQVKADYNVDSVYIVDFPYPSLYPYKGTYTHCIGVYLMKKGYSPTYIKCLLTNNGYAQKDLYLDTVKKSVRYGDGKWTYDASKERIAYKHLWDKTHGKTDKKKGNSAK